MIKRDYYGGFRVVQKYPATAKSGGFRMNGRQAQVLAEALLAAVRAGESDIQVAVHAHGGGSVLRYGWANPKPANDAA